MILYRWRGETSNFGDELNTLVWPSLLPGFFDDDPAARFLGIGSVLDRRHADPVLKIVAGSGYAGYQRKPSLDDTWVIHWVRGPRTAAMLGLPPNLALGDPATLLPSALGLSTGGSQEIAFMPHFESAKWGAWRQAAEIAGLRLIDPREPAPAILQAIGACRLLLSEALHGVIVADALRVPWIAVRPQARIHRAKWHDWADTVGLRPRFHDLPASTLREWVGTSRLCALPRARSWFDQRGHRLSRLPAPRLVARAADMLRRAADAEPQLSATAALDRCQSRMLEAVHTLRLRPLQAPPRVTFIARKRSYLPAAEDSAYQLG